jgi:hypothetical protein
MHYSRTNHSRVIISHEITIFNINIKRAGKHKENQVHQYSASSRKICHRNFKSHLKAPLVLHVYKI